MLALEPVPKQEELLAGRRRVRERRLRHVELVDENRPAASSIDDAHARPLPTRLMGRSAGVTRVCQGNGDLDGRG